MYYMQLRHINGTVIDTTSINEEYFRELVSRGYTVEESTAVMIVAYHPSI